MMNKYLELAHWLAVECNHIQGKDIHRGILLGKGTLEVPHCNLSNSYQRNHHQLLSNSKDTRCRFRRDCSSNSLSHYMCDLKVTLLYNYDFLKATFLTRDKVWIEVRVTTRARQAWATVTSIRTLIVTRTCIDTVQHFSVTLKARRGIHTRKVTINILRFALIRAVDGVVFGPRILVVSFFKFVFPYSRASVNAFRCCG